MTKKEKTVTLVERLIHLCFGIIKEQKDTTLSIMFNFTLIIRLNITLGTLATTIGVTATIVMCITY